MLVPMAACGSSSSSSAKGNTGSVSIACSQQEDFCQAMTRAFSKETGIKTTYVRLGAGEVLARLATNPGEFDVWAGGQAENHLLAQDKGWIENYKSSAASNYPASYKDTTGSWTGFYTDSIAFCSSKSELKKKNLKAPTSWNDLLSPALKKSVGMPHPATAGVGYMAMYTQAVLHNGDEQQSVNYFKQLNPNVMQYSKSAATGTEQAGRGEVTVAIALDSDCEKAIQAGYNDLVTSYPKEGTGYEVGAVSVLKNGHNKANAKKFTDWILGTKAQNLYAGVPSFAAPTNPKATIGKNVPNQDKVKKVKWDMRKAADSRDAFIKAFESEVSSSKDAK
ncbi:ABC transporter substrate-binding protein [Bifidobacterium sp. ESL0690]|uniref:ABC transporter substrate-binding protein n=1 Tax=Bifidobacterium sp. ESL0690 TaxID=2983214 RepID=UPI0023F9A881|nr:ABC transporter substrate-binding protein [Bifidobacterium sp. ESL0690]WEV46991.1 ABC transporter substrate-binding protein [Bifidobacterium sp. ESL0690]